jgi:ATP-dependent RNA helicase DDX10/DBP4
VRSIFLQKDKEVFNVEQLPLEDYAHALGLPTVPHVKLGNKQHKNQPHPRLDSSSEDDPPSNSKPKTKTDKMFSRQNQTVLTKHYQDLHSQGNTAFKLPPKEDDDNDLLTTKRKIDWDTAEIPNGGKQPVSKRQMRIGMSRKALARRAGTKGTRMTFDEEGIARPAYEIVSEKEFLEGGGGSEEMKKRFVEETVKGMRRVDEDDREEAKEKRRLKRLKRDAVGE